MIATLTLVLSAALAPPLRSATHAGGAVIEKISPADVDQLATGAVIFQDRDYTVAELPGWLEGANFLRGKIDGGTIRVSGPGRLTVLTPDPQPHATSQHAQLEGLGFHRLRDPETFQLFGRDPWNRVRVYEKDVEPGERLELGKYAVIAGFSRATGVTTPLTGDPASLEFRGDGGAGTFEPGALLYTDRPYVVAECPAWLRGQRFLRNSIDSTESWRITAPGVLTVLTPAPHPQASSQHRALDQFGFIHIEQPAAFQLFGTQEWDQTRIYQKHVAEGERLRLGKWVVALGFADATAHVAVPWGENDGERLYNGIILPREWPPQGIDPAGRTPLPVPYLDHPPPVVPIDIGRQLFVDDFLVQESTLSRTYHLPRKYDGNPVLWPETPWERGEVEPGGHTKPYGHGNAGAGPKSGGCWWDPTDQVFKLWYETSWFGPIAMATSHDGLRWTRPDLDVRPGTNIVSPVDLTPDSWTVVRNWQSADPDARWSLFVQPPGLPRPGLVLASADGIHWTRRKATGPAGDRSTHFHNPFRDKWVYSIRSAYGTRGRSRDYFECDDPMAGVPWESWDPVPWAFADDNDPVDPDVGDPAQLYNLDAVAYESLMLGMFQIHRGPDNLVCIEQGLPKITELNFAYSRDGFHWHRPDRRAHIHAERRDVWDRGYVQSLGNLCTIVGDTMYFYYIGFRGNEEKANTSNGMYDRSATGVAMLRRDGFASMDGDDGGGTLVTRPVRFSGRHLFVNVAAAEGSLRVEVLDEDGHPVAPFTLGDCVPVSADGTIEQVRWSGGDDLSALAGQPVRFRFELRSGSLYSFWVSRDRTGRSDGYVAGGGPGYTGPTDTVGRAALDALSQTPNY